MVRSAHWDLGVVHTQARVHNSNGTGPEQADIALRYRHHAQPQLKRGEWEKFSCFANSIWHGIAIWWLTLLLPNSAYTPQPIEYNYANDEFDIGILGAISRPCLVRLGWTGRVRFYNDFYSTEVIWFFFFVFCSVAFPSSVDAKMR